MDVAVGVAEVALALANTRMVLATSLAVVRKKDTVVAVRNFRTVDKPTLLNSLPAVEVVAVELHLLKNSTMTAVTFPAVIIMEAVGAVTAEAMELIWEMGVETFTVVKVKPNLWCLRSIPCSDSTRISPKNIRG